MPPVATCWQVRRWCATGLLVVQALSSATAARSQSSASPTASAVSRDVLVERTLAIVGGAVITQADVALVESLALLDPAAPSSGDATTQRLVDRWLMLHEVARFSPPEPAPAAMAERLAAIRARHDEATLVARLAASGRGPTFLEAWVRDDLRIAAYLEQRFASAGAPAEAEVAARVQADAAAFLARGVPLAEATVQVRAQLVEARRRELVADWLADLRRRTRVLVFPPGA